MKPDSFHGNTTTTTTPTSQQQHQSTSSSLRPPWASRHTGWFRQDTPTAHQCLHGERPWVAQTHITAATDRRVEKSCRNPLALNSLEFGIPRDLKDFCFGHVFTQHSSATEQGNGVDMPVGMEKRCFGRKWLLLCSNRVEVGCMDGTVQAVK